MRDTLVSDSLDSAKKLAFSSGPRRNRVVTLVGEVIDIAGTMSGGGKTVARGGMKASRPGSNVGDVDVATLRAWEKELKETRDQITKLRSMVDSLESKAKSLDKEAQAVDDSVPQLQIEADAAERAAQDTAKALPLLKKQAMLSAEDEKARAALDKSLQFKLAKLVCYNCCFCLLLFVCRSTHTSLG
jgi:structural maintenance of chromosome 4